MPQPIFQNKSIPWFPWQKLVPRLQEWRGVLLTVPTVTGLVVALRLTGVLQGLEWAALDEFFRRRPLEPTDPAIVIVEVTEEDIQAIGKWPMSDALLAELIRKIRQQQPIGIGLDLYRDLPIPPGQQELQNIFKTTPNLIGIEKVIGDGISPPIAPPSTLKELGQVGSNDIVPDSDGTIRRGILFLPHPQQEYIAGLGAQLALMYLEEKGVIPNPELETLELGGTKFTPFAPNDGGYVRADDGGYQILINFRGGPGSFRKVTITDVLENRIPPDLLRDRLVMIGPTAGSLKDFFYTPFSASWSDIPLLTSGVEIQATIASQMIQTALSDRPLIQVWPDAVEIAWILLWSGIGATVGWLLRRARWVLVSVIFAGGVLIGVCFLFFLNGVWIPVVPPAIAMLASVGLISRYAALLEHEDRNLVMNLFGRHVTPEVANAIWRDRNDILSQGRVQGKKLTATVLFTDIKDFTSIAEQLEPDALMIWLNEYMEAMSQAVLHRGGIVDKFMGDAIMAVFGVPIPRTSEAAIAEDAYQAVACALEMRIILQELNLRWQQQGRPTAAMRIGISTGPVVIGSLGSAQRLDYTTIGDSVNIASRLEGYDKSLEGGLCRILISEGTYELVNNQFHTRKIGTVLLRGRSQQITIYQINPTS